ncbi:MAG: autotransporter outer membrane beta-barrel domain-containing protein [Methylobacillus sp.]|nr:autotransporter outer membrane beta-barrel domain-containing protein [Methylobacillus sp.]
MGLLVTLPEPSFAQTITTTQIAGPGDTLILTNEIVQTTAASALAQNGGTIIINGGSVTSTGGVGPALQAGYLGASITVTNVDIATANVFSSGATAPGVRANPDSTITVIGGTITTTQNNSDGLWSTGDGATINATGVTIKTSGDSSTGAEFSGRGATAYGTGVMTLNDVNITTTGVQSYGLASSQSYAVTPGTPLLGDIEVKAVMTGGSITTSGLRGAAVFANSNNIVFLTNVTINTSGQQGFGVEGQYGAQITLNNVGVTTTGNFAYGLYAIADNDDGDPATITGTGVTVRTAGEQSHGLYTLGLSSITLANSTVTTTGVDAAAIYGRARIAPFSFGSGASGPGTVNITNSTLISEQGDGIWVTGTQFDFADTFSRMDVTLTDSSLTSNTGAWLRAQSGLSTDSVPVYAAVTVDADHSQLRGFAQTDLGSTADVVLRNGSLWTMTGSSNLTTLENNASTINFTTLASGANPTLLASYKTLTVTSYTGASGVIGLNSWLESDGSPSDRLVIDGGSATGTTALKFANTGGAGDLTTGNGILVVDAINSATTAAGAFSLAAPVTAGPYEYTLFRSSTDPSAPESWYLRSTLNCNLAPNAAICGNPPVDPPNYNIETSLNTVLPSMALLYGRNLMDTLHERVGEETDLNNLQDRYPDDRSSLGWVRLIGTHGKQDGSPRGIYGAGGPEFDYDFYAFQGGFDLYRRERNDGRRDQAGVLFSIGGADGTVTHFDGTHGKDRFTAYALGGYWTHFGQTGWYLDTVLQATWYDAETTANRGFKSFNTEGLGLAASAEIGKPFRNESNGYFIEPQAQIIYQTIDLHDANQPTTTSSARVKYSDVDSLVGRIGARLGRTWSLDENMPHGRQVTAWIRPNIWREFRGDPITKISSATGDIPFRADLGGTWGEINIGISAQRSLNTTLFANASYNQRFDGNGYAYDGKIGVRINW